MKLVSWNLAGRVQALPEQAAAVARERADVVCLQEVTKRTLPLWREALRQLRYQAVLCTLDDGLLAGKRRLGVLIASKRPLERAQTAPDLPWPERVLAAVHTYTGIEITCVHSPISQTAGRVKVLTHEALFAHLRVPDLELRPRVLVGDLNTPRREPSLEAIMTFAYASNGKLRADRGERHDMAERALVQTLVQFHGWKDAYRALHGYGGEKVVSWAWPHGGGYRLDHVLCGPWVTPVACEYRHQWRLTGLSDHSGVVAEVQADGDQPKGGPSRLSTAR